MRHFVIVAVLVVIITILVSIGLQNAPILPADAALEATLIDGLFGLHLRVIAFLFSLIVVFTLYSVIVFRRKAGDTEDGPHVHGNTQLEIIWTVIPLVTVLFFGILGARQLGQITAPDPDELVVNVTAQQFAWSFEYPVLGITSPELNLPNGQPVLLKLSATDVIHSFWVPEFRVKQDAVPGKTTELRITPSQVGAYKVRCAEICGTAHYSMLAPVNVVEPADFEAWVADRTAAARTVPATAGEGEALVEATGAQLGAELAQSQGCIACHSADGSQMVGPTWAGLYGENVTLDDGSVIIADDEYLRRSIVETNAQIVQGYPANVMPAIYEDTLSPEQIDALVEYIKSLAN